MAELKQLLRPDLLVFLKTEAETYHLMGMGLEEQVLSMNPKSDTKGYIHQTNSNTSVYGYEAQLNAPQEGWKGVPVFDWIDEKAMKFAVGSDLETEVIIVRPYRENFATKHNAVAVINEVGGSHGEPLMTDYEVHLNGDPVLGTATVNLTEETATFTADLEA